jgi:hypothetical protein
MTESIIYRANLIPERNRQKFLRLLGIPMQAAQAAKGLVSFSNPNGSLAVVTLEKDIVLSAGNVPFRTSNALQVLPVDAKVYYKRSLGSSAELDTIYNALYASYQANGGKLAYYETQILETPNAGSVLPVLDVGTETIDGSLWIALLARPGDNVNVVRDRLGGAVITLGVMPALSREGCTLYARGAKVSDTRPSLVYEIPNVANKQAAYSRLKPRVETDLLAHPGVVELILPHKEALNYWQDLDPLEAGTGDFPPSLEDTDDGERLITWIRLRSPEASASGVGSVQVHIPISWIGINAAQVQQRAHVETEQLTTGTGEPDQIATLSNTPVIKDSVGIRVNGELWTQLDDLQVAAPEVPGRSPRFSAMDTGSEASIGASAKVFTVDRESGEVRFGDGLHGKRPPRGAGIQASYDYGGGRRGSVGIGAINKGENLPPGIQVVNAVPTWGGEEGETVAQAEKRINGFMRNRDRMVSKQDIEDIVLATPGVDLGRREVLPLTHPGQLSQESYGVVTVLVIPRNDAQQPEAPRPDSLFLQTICEYLSPRRILTTELHVRGPEYVPVWLSLSVEVIPGREAGPVLEAVRTAVRNFLSPLYGGFERSGWPLDKSVEAAEVSAVAAGVSGVAKIKEALIGGESGATAGVVAIEGLQLPRLMAIEVTTGTAAGISEIQGALASSIGQREENGVPVRVTPVPVIPDQC